MRVSRRDARTSKISFDQEDPPDADVEEESEEYMEGESEEYEE